MSDYRLFLESKRVRVEPSGVEYPGDMHPSLFPFQSDIVRWALRRGRACIFADCGMGKTLMQLAWADKVQRHTGGKVLILAPLAVSNQTVDEGARFGISVKAARTHSDIDGPGIWITNYEMLHHFTPREFSGVVLDESSILKAYTGKVRTQIIESFVDTPFRLACTATPSPNDYMELGNHAEFMGAMSRTEMLSMYFIHDGGETQKWRLKGHAEGIFWKWVCSWAVMIRRPSDLGYSDDGFILPDLIIVSDVVGEDNGSVAATLHERRKARRESIGQRVERVASMVNATDHPWLVWVDLNDEGDAMEAAIPGSVQVAGADSPEDKADRMLGFASGKYRVLITKPSIAGFGMNWQHCADMAFVGLSDSYEKYYQAIRRCWRFGQANAVTAHVVTAPGEAAVVDNINRKEEEAKRMADEMVTHMADISSKEIRGLVRTEHTYKEDQAHSDLFKIHLGDCVEVLATLPDASVDYTVFSPPFASLYTYSNSERDMGNARTHSEFFEHFKFAIGHLLRVTKPGRLCSFHCMNLPTSKTRDGVIGLTDFRGELIRAFRDAGWIYHSEVVIWKNPVTAMQRTKALGLLHKQLKKDSGMSRQGIPDYLVTMRAPGDNAERVTHTDDGFPVAVWQQYASPVWMDINPSDTLQYRSARADQDERHICPLQLGVIERAIELWSNPGDTVLSPFAGIGSEGFVALRRGRKFVGIELKESYFNIAKQNLAAAASEPPDTRDVGPAHPDQVEAGSNKANRLVDLIEGNIKPVHAEMVASAPDEPEGDVNEVGEVQFALFD